MTRHCHSMSTMVTRRMIGSFVWWIAVCVISVVTVAPLLWTLATSFKPAGEILRDALSFIPRSPTLDNYIQVFTTVPFARYFVNTLIVAVGGVVCNLFLGSMAGYALAKLEFRGRRAVFLVYLASMMIPSIVTMIPTFLVLRQIPLIGGNDISGHGGMGLINTYWAVILPGAAGAFAVFFMKQFFESIPDELGEAARVDGAGELQIFLRIYLPLAKSGLAVLGLLTFQSGWNNFLWPLIVLNDPKMMTVQVGLAGFTNNYSTDYGPLMAGTVVTMLPVLLLFLFSQRWIVEGIAHTGGK
ncbi:carbohydrate ABC transporter permease [Bifidobacterium scardovii]|uniref:ABC transporter permease n=1 Tax=Bifidobacterium scardovii TaxID=158787 RepID=A0A087D3J7_9BIFI|nr:carbohydrate ABC transporter permease [Bifidobacterium scardovii]KFI90097.1 ABC transporter permease [Bifidobacterium scardovii]MDK6349209.1 carbohydrate ABC transporter permease [Bifidobacterium scardovii]MDU2421994.1 carbohydrate ABC transporter permease [Bifidobacterium scardovii]MDU8980750.1 carbohydrate ABC transporter permease [Bifidobacterium scardovii]